MGAALYSPHLNIELQFKLSEYTSIYSAEAIAIGEAIQHILDHNIPHSLICSDSKSVLETASGSNPSSNISHLIFKIRNLLFLANQSNLDVSLIWIPGHVGVDGNEIVDVLAKNAATDGQILDLPLTHTDIWVSFHMLQCNSTIRISRLRTNHYSLAASLARKNFIEFDECPHCRFPGEDINYVLWACPKYYDSRKTMEAYLIKLKCFPPFSIEPFLSNLTSRPVFLIFKFLKENNLFI